MSDEGEWAHSPDDTDRIASLEAEVKRLCTDAERERLARRAVDQALREAMAEVERLREAIHEHRRRVLDARDEHGPPILPLDAADEALWAASALTAKEDQ